MAPERLQKLAACIREPTLAARSNSQLLNAPIVTLFSAPRRSRSGILALLSDQFLADLSQIEIINNRRNLVEFALTRLTTSLAKSKFSTKWSFRDRLDVVWVEITSDEFKK